MSLRLLPGRSVRDAVQELARQEMAVGNVRAAGHASQDLLREFLNWALGAERMLRNHFTASSISAVIFTQRYWALQTSGTSNWEGVRSLVEAEIVEQTERLLHEKAVLDQAQSRWGLGRLVVLDTSAVIHGPKLWEWDPAADLGLRDLPVQLVLPILVLDELDGLKESTKHHTRSRARQTLKWVADQLGSSESFLIRQGATEGPGGPLVRGDVHLDVLLDDPGHTRLPIADEEIVDRAAALASVSGRDVLLVTNDTSQGYRAQLAGLDFSMVVDPLYDVDIQEAAKDAEKADKARRATERRAAQEARRGRRPGERNDPSAPASDASQDTDG